MAQRYAVIDLGTNTFHLLVAELTDLGLQQLYAEKVGVRLGKGGITKGIIADDAQERAISCLHGFAKRLVDMGIAANQAVAFGTSAMRNAANGAAVAAKLETETGIRVNIIDGDQEAAYIYNGVRHSFTFTSQASLVMDIGGGSVEFILANNAGLLWQGSFEVGGQRLLDMFMQQDPIEHNQISQLENWLDEQLTPLWQACKQHKPTTLVGSAGTFETLADMCFFKLHSEHMPFEETTWEELPLSTIAQLTQELVSKSKEERLLVPGMIELRADMSVVAMLLLRHVLKRTGVNRVVASLYALKEGVFYTLAEEQAS